MKVHFSVVGQVVRPDDVKVTMDAIPRLGETVTLPGLPPHATNVRTVVWYPLGDVDDDDPEPFVYIVLGQARRVDGEG